LGPNIAQFSRWSEELNQQPTVQASPSFSTKYVLTAGSSGTALSRLWLTVAEAMARPSRPDIRCICTI
ncbi:hypothetical protein, partial [Roseovarius sp. D22-M7]|uniref:hypothetical protein n=1 Tax=Roseovarius sp. D22-M7 TaxID=3127116 RepID=UPI00301047C1